MSFWTCSCGKVASGGVTKCRGCNKDRPKVGFIDETTKSPDTADKKHKRENNRKIARLPEPEEGKFFTSTLKKPNAKKDS